MPQMDNFLWGLSIALVANIVILVVALVMSARGKRQLRETIAKREKLLDHGFECAVQDKFLIDDLRDELKEAKRQLAELQALIELANERIEEKWNEEH